MKKLNRREFINKSTFGFGSALLLSRDQPDSYNHLFSPPIKTPIGFQVYTIKDILVKDFPCTLKMMANLGYKSVGINKDAISGGSDLAWI